MPTDLPSRISRNPEDRRAQADLLSDALASNDAHLVSRALHDIAAAQGQHFSFGDDPALGIVLAAINALEIDLTAQPRS